MTVLDVASFQLEGQDLIVVFVPPETTILNDEQRGRLLNILVQTGSQQGFAGELVAVWDEGGTLKFMAHPKWHPWLSGESLENISGRKNGKLRVQ